MTNHPNRSGKFELTFWGGVDVRYRRNHKTVEQAKAEALKVLGKINNRNAHPAIIYGPELGKDGLTVL
jgi:hypothetical protein